MRCIDQTGKAGLRILGLRETFAAACSTSKSCFRLPLHSRMKMKTGRVPRVVRVAMMVNHVQYVSVRVWCCQCAVLEADRVIRLEVCSFFYQLLASMLFVKLAPRSTTFRFNAFWSNHFLMTSMYHHFVHVIEIPSPIQSSQLNLASSLPSQTPPQRRPSTCSTYRPARVQGT
jgi:hypothetical protein